MKKMMMTMNKMITRTIITCHLVIMSNHYNNSILIFLINNNYSKTLCNKHNPTKITHTQIFNTSSSNNKLYCQINHLTEVSYSSQAISIYLNNKIEMMIVTMMIMSSSNLNPQSTKTQIKVNLYCLKMTIKVMTTKITSLIMIPLMICRRYPLQQPTLMIYKKI